MRFDPPLIPARLLRRYKRFLADVELEDGRRLTVHCPNTGSMLGCAEPGSRVWLSESGNPDRKYPHTWEQVEVDDGRGATVVGVHTGRTNALVAEAVEQGRIPGLPSEGQLRREVYLPREDGGRRHRVDLVWDADGGPWFIEVKNVTAAVADGVAVFPDAVSERGRSHVETLGRMAADGARCMVVFAVQRSDVGAVAPADSIDPAFGEALRRAAGQGLALRAIRGEASAQGIELSDPIPVLLDVRSD